MINERIGFVGGGKMAEALIQGILQAELVGGEQIYVADPDENRRQLLKEKYKVHAAADNAVIKDSCHVVVLAVKPQIMSVVLKDLAKSLSGGQLIISIAAGITLSFIEGYLQGTGVRVIRVMPNTPALVLAGASVLSGGTGVNKDDLELTLSIFQAVGKAFVAEEKYLDAVTGLSGSGPAYVYSFIEGLIDGGVKMGLARPLAEELAVQTVLGATRLMEEEKQHPAVLKAMVTSPGGTTISGLHVMERSGFRGIVMDAIEAATQRSVALGKDS